MMILLWGYAHNGEFRNGEFHNGEFVGHNGEYFFAILSLSFFAIMGKGFIGVGIGLGAGLRLDNFSLDYEWG